MSRDQLTIAPLICPAAENKTRWLLQCPLGCLWGIDREITTVCCVPFTGSTDSKLLSVLCPQLEILCPPPEIFGSRSRAWTVIRSTPIVAVFGIRRFFDTSRCSRWRQSVSARTTRADFSNWQVICQQLVVESQQRFRCCVPGTYLLLCPPGHPVSP